MLTISRSSGRVEYLTLTDPEKIWMPDLFFKNEKTGQLHQITMPNMYIRIFSDGGVLYSVRRVDNADVNTPFCRQLDIASGINHLWKGLKNY